MEVASVTQPQHPSGVARRVVLATDGSAHAQAALALLTELSWPPTTTFWVVRVVDNILPTVPKPGHTVTGAEADWRQVLELAYTEARQRAETAVREVASVLRQRFADSRVEEVVRFGEPAGELLAQIGESDADLVVAGARGHTVFHGLLLGSVSEALAMEAPCPVLIVHDPAPELKRIVVAIRTETDADRLAGACRLLPLPPQTEIVAVTVLQPLPFVRPSIVPSVNAYLEGLRQELAAVEEAEAETIHCHLGQRIQQTEPDQPASGQIVRGEAAPAILAEAEALDARLIVVAAREHHGVMGRLGLGSVSRKLIRRASGAVLVVRDAANDV